MFDLLKDVFRALSLLPYRALAFLSVQWPAIMFFTRFRKPARIVFMGPENAGKTTLAWALQHNDFAYIEWGDHDGVEFSNGLVRSRCFDLGGKPRLQGRRSAPLHGVAFLVDASDPARLEDARLELHALLMNSDPHLRTVPVAVLGNKIDIPGAIGEDELREQLALSSSSDIVIQCRKVDDGHLTCESLGGRRISTFPVPPGQPIFGSWVVDEVLNALPKKIGQLRLIDPMGQIFATKMIIPQEVNGHRIQIFMASIKERAGYADAFRWLSDALQ